MATVLAPALTPEGGGSLTSQSPDGAAPPPLILFRSGAHALDASERAALFATLSLAPAADGKGYVDTVCGQPALAEADALDLNGDGQPEVLAVFGNTCLSGFAGSSVAVFVGGTNGYTPHVLGGGAAAEPLGAGNLGYPDLRLGVPGFCFPVFRWNGTTYEHHRDDPQEAGGCGVEERTR